MTKNNTLNNLPRNSQEQSSWTRIPVAIFAAAAGIFSGQRISPEEVQRTLAHSQETLKHADAVLAQTDDEPHTKCNP